MSPMIGMASLQDNASMASSLTPAAYTAGGNGASFDLANAENWHALVHLGTWTDGTHTITFESSPDDTVWTAVPKEDLSGFDLEGVQALDGTAAAFVISDDSRAGGLFVIEYTGAMGVRYLRAVNAAAGTTTGAVFSVAIMKTGGRYVGRNPMNGRWNTSNIDP